MKKAVSLLLAAVLCVSMCGCSLQNLLRDQVDGSMQIEVTEPSTGSTENAKVFYDKVTECAALIDLVATDVCAVWKDAAYDYTLSTKDVNAAIEEAQNAHKDNIKRINELDAEIRDLYESARAEMKDFTAQYAIKDVMTTYAEYMDSVLNANEALDPNGYVSISIAKDSLDRALRDLFAEM